MVAAVSTAVGEGLEIAKPREARVQAARTTYRVALAYVGATTLIWAFLTATGADGGLFFRNDPVTVDMLVRVLVGFLVFWVGWSWAFYRLKRRLLRRAGMGDADLKLVFSNRLEGFELETLLRPYSERAIRIADMVGRRGRTMAGVFMGFYFVAKGIGENPTPDSLALGLETNLLEGTLFAWWGLITFHSNGILGRIHYGAQARIMDGVLARANALCIGTLWHAFKFVMIPLGFGLAAVFPPEGYAVVFALIWFGYMSCDFASEIFGSLFGRQTIRVWGLGDVNRKSVVGTASGFAAAFLVCNGIVLANDLGLAWHALATAVSISSTLLELYSPRGSDDFTMATGNAFLCWAFGSLFLAS